MRKPLFFITAIASFALTACNKEASTGSQAIVPSGEIRFSLGKLDLDINTTKSVTAVTTANLDKVYWEASEGTTVKYAVAQYNCTSSGSNKIVNTGKFWPKDGATYNYKVSNASFVTSTGVITASNTTDIVVGTASGVVDNSCNITLDHIFARTGDFVCNNGVSSQGYTLSNTGFKIESYGSTTGTSGSYKIGSGWQSRSSALSKGSVTSSSDMYLLPGEYTVYVTYTLTKGAFVKTYNKSAVVNFGAGVITSITATADDDDASEITFMVSVNPWTTTTIEPEFS